MSTPNEYKRLSMTKPQRPEFIRLDSEKMALAKAVRLTFPDWDDSTMKKHLAELISQWEETGIAPAILAPQPQPSQGEVGLDKPVSALKSVQDAWQRAFDKYGEQYANDIFPDGRPGAIPGAMDDYDRRALDKARQERDALQAQRDDLLAALKHIELMFKHHSAVLPFGAIDYEGKAKLLLSDISSVSRVTRAAIARATGGQS